MKGRKASFLVACVVLLVDQLSKLLVNSKLVPGESIPIVENLFHISLVNNTGCAFGMLPYNSLFLTILSVLTILVISIFCWRFDGSDLILRAGAGMIIGGACGNLLDRLRFGYVIDFLDFRVWPVFNIADTAITVGVILVIWRLCFKGRIPTTCMWSG